MSKIYTQLWLIAAMLGALCPTYSQEKYSIQIGAFTEQIKPSFFDFAGFHDVQYETTASLYHTYKWGNFPTPEAAAKQLHRLQKNAPTHGLNNLKIVPTPLDFVVPLSNNNGATNSSQNTEFQLFSRSVNFSNAKLSLKKTDVEVLEEIAIILENNPSLKLRIFATKAGKKRSMGKRHISPAASNIIKNFLLAKDIPAYRIKTIAAKDITANATKSITKVNQVFMTLVDLKEEIVFDRFGQKGYIAKELMEEKILNSDIILQ